MISPISQPGGRPNCEGSAAPWETSVPPIRGGGKKRRGQDYRRKGRRTTSFSLGFPNQLEYIPFEYQKYFKAHAEKLLGVVSDAARLSVALAFAMIGGAVAVFTVSSTYDAACPTSGC
jgi:hypothetical protein